MAFNPFNTFRKNSKVIFAGLTIMCMFVFILSSGIGQGGDFFDWLPRQIGLGRTDKTELARAYGEKITTRNIEQLRLLRLLANQYMLSVTERANAALMEEVERELPKLQKSTQEILRAPVQIKRMLADPEKIPANLRQFILPTYLQQLNQSMVLLINELDQIKEKQKKNPDTLQAELEAVTKVLHVLRSDQRLFAQSGNRGTLMYFSNEPDTTRTLIEFDLWLQKADRLGIRLSPSEVNRLINLETMNALRSNDSAQVEEAIRKNRQRFTTDELLLALSNEFRVRMAKAALAGEASRMRGTLTTLPAYVTPYDFYQFYKENRTPLTLSLIEVPATRFYGEVRETPSEDELRRFFNQYVRNFPDPSRDEPGFREPRKVKVEWVAGSAQSPIYKKTLPYLWVATQVGCAAPTLPLAAEHWPATLIHASLPRIAEAVPLNESYEQRQRNLLPWSDATTPQVHETSVVQALPFALAVAQTAANLGTKGSPFGAGLALESRVILHEIRDRVRVGMQLVLAPMQAGFQLPAIAPIAAAIPQPLPFAAVEKLLRERRMETLVENFFVSDITAFRDKLQKLGEELQPTGKDAKPLSDEEKKKKTEAIRAFIADWVKVRGFETNSNDEFRDRFTLQYKVGKPVVPGELPPLEPDPALLPLVLEFQKTLFTRRMTRPDDPMPMFGEQFFMEPSRIDPNFKEPRLYQPTWFPDGMPPSPNMLMPDTKVYLAWRRDELEPRTPKFEEARPEVEKAWKLRKARELAKKKAEQLAQQVKNLKGSRPQIDQLAIDGKYKQFELYNVSKLVERKATFHAGQMPTLYRPYRIPEEQEKLLPYPTADLYAKLLSLSDKPIGDTVVVVDQPGSTYYVAALIDRREPDIDTVNFVYGRTRATIPSQQDTLMRDHAIPAEMVKAIEEIRSRLKAEAKYSEKTEVIEKMMKNTADE